MKKLYGAALLLTTLALWFFVVEFQLARFRRRLTTALPGMIVAAILKERGEQYG